MYSLKRAFKISVLVSCIVGIFGFLFILLPKMMSAKDDIVVGLAAAVIVVMLIVLAVVVDAWCFPNKTEIK